MEERPVRRPTRLRKFDYSAAGCYFVTVCTRDRRLVLSAIAPVVGAGFHAGPWLRLTQIGVEVEKAVQFIGTKGANIAVDKYVVMPNHVHMIVTMGAGGHGNPPLQALIGEFKSFTTGRYRALCQVAEAILWQRSFYDHVIRDAEEYESIWTYIDNNPKQWALDRYYCEEDKH